MPYKRTTDTGALPSLHARTTAPGSPTDARASARTQARGVARTVAAGLGGRGLAGRGPADVVGTNEQLRALRGDGERAEAHHRKRGDREGCRVARRAREGKTGGDVAVSTGGAGSRTERQQARDSRTNTARARRWASSSSPISPFLDAMMASCCPFATLCLPRTGTRRNHSSD